MEYLPNLKNENDKKSLFIAIDRVTDPNNLGSIIRSSIFFNVKGIITETQNVAPLNPVVSKTSSGALEFATVYQTANLKQFLFQSKANGYFVIGASTPNGTNNNYTEASKLKLENNSILVMGSEGKGLRRSVIEQCNLLCSISPVTTNYNNTTNDNFSQYLGHSLNVNVATGILLYQLSMSQIKEK